MGRGAAAGWVGCDEPEPRAVELGRNAHWWRGCGRFDGRMRRVAWRAGCDDGTRADGVGWAASGSGMGLASAAGTRVGLAIAADTRVGESEPTGEWVECVV